MTSHSVCCDPEPMPEHTKGAARGVYVGPLTPARSHSKAISFDHSEPAGFPGLPVSMSSAVPARPAMRTLEAYAVSRSRCWFRVVSQLGNHPVELGGWAVGGVHGGA